MIRKILISLFSTKEKIAIWMFSCAILLIISILMRDTEVWDWEIQEKILIGIMVFTLIISFGYFSAMPLKEHEMSEKQKEISRNLKK